MLKQYAQILRWLIILTDCFLMGVAFFLAYHARRHWFLDFFPYNLYFLKVYLWILPTVIILWAFFLYSFGMYQSFRLKKLRSMIWLIIKSGIMTFVIFSAAAYIFKIENISRSFVCLFFATTTLILIVEKIVLIAFFRFLRTKGFNFRNILVVGTGRRAQRFIKYLHQHRELGLKVMGLVDEDVQRQGAMVQDLVVLGGLSDVPRILRDHVVDYVVFIVPRASLNKIEPALKYCELVGVSASVAMDFFNLKFTSGKDTNILGIPMVTFEPTPHSVSALLLKRLLDVAISLTALVVIMPVYFLVALLIKCTSPGPVYFCQERIGLNGRKFKLYKFRTMDIHAEKQLKNLMAFNEMSGPAFKMDKDPRVTSVGRLLRKYSLDELPQLWNVFHGDMSLVGPRPPLEREVKQYDPWHTRRLSMRPGITCYWQIKGRNRISDFDQWVKMDLEYIDNWSLMLDVKILLKTIPAVLSTSGAK